VANFSTGACELMNLYCPHEFPLVLHVKSFGVFSLLNSLCSVLCVLCEPVATSRFPCVVSHLTVSQLPRLGFRAWQTDEPVGCQFLSRQNGEPEGQTGEPVGRFVFPTHQIL
jgi:hypothetical protein